MEKDRATLWLELTLSIDNNQIHGYKDYQTLNQSITQFDKTGGK